MPNDNIPAVRSEAEIEAELLGSAPPVGDDTDDSDDAAALDTPAATAAPDSAAEAAAERAEASRRGWVPKDKYTGDPDKWVDAKTYNERGRNFNKKLQEELALQKAEVERLKQTTAAFKKFTDEQMAAKEAELAATVTELRKLRLQAIREDDDDTALAVEDKLDAVRKEQAAIVAAKEAEAAAAKSPQQDPQLTAEYKQWASENPWFESDPVLQAITITVGQQLRAKGDKTEGMEFFKRVEQIVREDFPQKFEQDAPRKPRNPVESSRSSTSSRTSGKTEANLPAADREIMNDLVAEGLTTKEKFLENYFSRT